MEKYAAEMKVLKITLPFGDAPHTVDPHLSEHLGTKGWSNMRNVQITETGLNAL